MGNCSGLSLVSLADTFLAIAFPDIGSCCRVAEATWGKPLHP